MKNIIDRIKSFEDFQSNDARDLAKRYFVYQENLSKLPSHFSEIVTIINKGKNEIIIDFNEKTPLNFFEDYLTKIASAEISFLEYAKRASKDSAENTEDVAEYESIAEMYRGIRSGIEKLGAQLTEQYLEGKLKGVYKFEFDFSDELLR